MEVKSYGKTPYERVKGKRSEVMDLEFCENVLWKYHPGKRMSEFDARWGYGLFWGVRSRSRELIVLDGDSKEAIVCPDSQAHPGGATVGPRGITWS